MNVLVYDNQLAYYKLLISNFSGKYNFTRFTSKDTASTDVVYDVMMFFLQDELELLDFIKLYNKTVPMVLCLALRDKEEWPVIEENIYYLHLDKFKDEIVKDAGLLLQKLAL